MEFLDALKPHADEETQKSKEFPKTPRGLRSKLERINPNLRAIGIHITFLEKSNKGRTVRLEYSRKQPSEPSDSQEPAQNQDETVDGSNSNSQSNRQTVSQQSANSQSGKYNNGNGLSHVADGSDGSDGRKQPYSTIQKCHNCKLEMKQTLDKLSYFCPIGCGSVAAAI